MLNRTKLVFGLVIVGMLSAGVAWAGSGSGSAGATATADVTAQAAGEGSIVVPVEEAGVVTLGRIDSGLSILEIEPRPGWDVAVEKSFGTEVEARLVSGASRVDFRAELDGADVKIRIESAEGSTTSTLVTTTSVAVPTTSSTTASTTSSTEGTTSTSQASTSTSQATTSTTVGAIPTSTSSSSTSTTVATTSTTQATTSTTLDDALVSIPDGVKVFTVGTAGTVTVEIRAGHLALARVQPAVGWSFEVDKAESDDVRVEFESSADAEAELRVRIRDGRLQVETRSD